MAAAVSGVGLIGPNAITRVAEAMTAQLGADAARQLFERAGLSAHLRHPPEQMVQEAEVRRLHAALVVQLGTEGAREVADAAGRRTADYLLAHRIPKLLQRVLVRLPAGLSARVLLSAITRHAWTFVGSGQFKVELGTPVLLHIRHNPLCVDQQAETPACHFYAATFERLFQVLVHPASRVLEVACEACGDAECRFEIRWQDRV